MIVVRDLTADVISGAIPKSPYLLRPGAGAAEVASWACETPAIRALCADWHVSADTVGAPVGAFWAVLDALGDGAAVVHLAGRHVALNSDGTRCAYDDTVETPAAETPTAHVDTLTLTTAHAASFYDIPVLVIDGLAYRPSDMTPDGIIAVELLREWAQRFCGPSWSVFVGLGDDAKLDQS